MENGNIYIARPRESLYVIARRLGVDVKELKAANPDVKCITANIEGDIVMLPQSSHGRCPNGFLYTVRPGDTFFLLARRFGTTVAAIQAANPGVDPLNLQVGQSICIPAKQPEPRCPNGFLYTVRPGDTFFLLARRFGTTVAAIQAANPGVDPLNLQVGQAICIPKN